MDNKRNYLVIVAIILSTVLFSGCYSTSQCLKHCSDCLKTDSVKEKDSLSVSTDSSRKEKIRVDTIKVYYPVPGPTVYQEHPCANLCDSLGHLKQYDKTEHKNGMTNRMFTRNDSLIDECKQDSILAVNKTIERELDITKRIYELKTKDTIKTLLQSKKSGWQIWLEATYKYTAWFFYICVLLALIFLIAHWYANRTIPLKRI